MRGIDAYRLGQRIRARALTELLRRDFAGFGHGTVIQPPVEIWGETRIELGAGSLIGPATRLFAWAPSGRIRIADRVRLNGHNMLTAAADLEIGAATAIARGVYVTDHNHARSDPNTPIRDQGLDGIVPVRIGSGVWIGQNACIIRASVGDGAVVAANAVVTRDVPAGTVVAGVPAKVIGER